MRLVCVYDSGRGWGDTSSTKERLALHAGREEMRQEQDWTPAAAAAGGWRGLSHDPPHTPPPLV